MTDTQAKASDILAKVDPAKKPKHHDIVSTHVKHLAGKGLHDPSSLTPAEVRELCGSALAHIARHE